MNSFGQIFRLTDFGESHGIALGGIIDGVPAGITIDIDKIQEFADRRRPGQSKITTSRNEDDKIEILSGIFQGKTLGTPIGFIIRNKEHHSSDYNNIENAFRPSHADYTYQMKYGLRDHRGGGRSSARETVARMVAGAIALQILQSKGIEIAAYTSQIGDISLPLPYSSYDLAKIDTNIVRCPDAATAEKMEDLVMNLKATGDTTGGVITCVAKGVPAGLGTPVFDKLSARLAYAMMSINAAKGFEYGDGFSICSKTGSETVDKFINDNGKIRTLTNHSGGIQGGISNGEDIVFRVAFKPVATLLQEVDTVDINGNPIKLHAKGRHDPCVVPRAVPIVEAMTAMVLLDAYLCNFTTHI